MVQYVNSILVNFSLALNTKVVPFRYDFSTYVPT
jgi:hypothetical protein